MVVDLVWFWYLATVCVAVAVGGPGVSQGQPIAYVAVHLGLIGVLAVLRRAVSGRSPRAQLWARGAYTALCLPIVFSAMGWVLPAIHPEPYEWVWIGLDRQVLGFDPTVALGAWCTPWVTEVLQWAYASFYLIPLSTVAMVGWRRHAFAFEDALTAVAFCFLLSYLGYFLWPTLPPYRFLPHGEPLHGVFLAETLRAAIDAAELHRWDCFPSGHTMVSVLSLLLAWRWMRGLFWCLLPLVVLLLVSTVALRYHFTVDVAVGLGLVLPTLWMARVLVPNESRRSRAT